MSSSSASALPEVTSRVNTPPPHTNLSGRSLTPIRFEHDHPTTKEVRTNSNTVSWSCDGKKLLSCGLERGVRGWPLDNFEERNTFALTATGIIDYITSVNGHPSQPDVLCGASERDKKIMFWDFRARSATRIIDVGTSVRSIQFSKDGQNVLVREDGIGDAPDAVALFDVKTGSNILRVTAKELGMGNLLTDVKFNHNGDLAYVSGGSGAFAVLDYPSLELLHKFDAHIHQTMAIGVDVRGRYVATGGADALVNLWSPQDWIGQRALPYSETSLVALSFSGDGEYLASSGEAPYIDIAETETGQLYTRIPHRGVARSLAWHPSRTILASASGEKRGDSWIRLWR